MFTKIKIYLPLVFILSLTACSTMRADQLLASQFTPEEKATRLFLDGVARYNEEIIEADNLRAIPAIRTRFSDSLALDPELLEAQQYIDEINALAESRFALHIQQAWEFYSIKERSEEQNYLLLLNARMAGDIRPMHYKVLIMRISTMKELKTQINQREDRLDQVRTAVIEENTLSAIAGPLLVMDGLLNEITSIDPDNKLAAENRTVVDQHIASLVQNDIDNTKLAISEGRFSEAAISLEKAELSILEISKGNNAELEELKYNLYYDWANANYVGKNYQVALQKINQALSVRESSQALELRQQINRAVSVSSHSVTVRNYDDELPDMLARVDSFISQGKLDSAWNSINENLPRLKVAANRDLLNAKKAVVMEELALVYQEGVALYNEEDYELARTKLLLVLRISPEYEQAEAYMTRLNNKLRALSGQ